MGVDGDQTEKSVGRWESGETAGVVWAGQLLRLLDTGHKGYEGKRNQYKKKQLMHRDKNKSQLVGRMGIKGGT